MNTKELEKCLYLIDYWSNSDETVIAKTLDNDTDFIRNYLEPYRKELDKNLLSKNTIEAKKDIIKYYIFEFYELQGFFKINESILYSRIDNDNVATLKRIDEVKTDFEKYVIVCLEYFDIIFNEIQLCCIKYNIDFFKICNELNFSTKYFDSGITLAFEEMRMKNIPPQQTEKPKLETKETDLSERIKKHFGFFNRNCPRKHKKILMDTDFEMLIDWTIWYFENEFKVPEISQPIKVVNTNKTFVQLAFKYLFKELHKSSPYPGTLFEFYQSAFIPYSEDKKSNFEAVKNNDEVKKLMQID